MKRNENANADKEARNSCGEDVIKPGQCDAVRHGTVLQPSVVSAPAAAFVPACQPTDTEKNRAVVAGVK